MMKKMITLIIFFMMITNVAFCEKVVYTLNEIIEIFDNSPQTTLSFHAYKPTFQKSFLCSLSSPITVKSTINSEIEHFDATVKHLYTSPTNCSEVSLFMQLPNDCISIAYAFVEEALGCLKLHNIQKEEYIAYYNRYIKEATSDYQLEKVLTNGLVYSFYMQNGVNMEVARSFDNASFTITIKKEKETSVEPVGAGFFIGDTHQTIKSSANIHIIEEKDSVLTFTSELLSFPAYFQFGFNENQELSHGKIFVAGSYSLDCESFKYIERELSSVYEKVQEYNSDTLLRTTYVTNKIQTFDIETAVRYGQIEPPNIDGTICIHEIKEEEGTVYHTLTFMPEEEYNQTLFQNYLNN